MILEHVKDRIPKCMELIKEAGEEEDSDEQVGTRKESEVTKKIIELCGIKGKCSRETALKEINEWQDIFNLLRDIATALVSDAPKTKKEFLKIVRKERQVSYENHKKEPFSKPIKLAKKGLWNSGGS